jgi:ParB/RepB/Spo0J family partition protein
MKQHKITTMAISRLQPHPLQKITFGQTSAEDDAQLAKDLRERGQLDPIIVMPRGNAAGLPAWTILDGHRRIQLLKAAGHKEVKVLVREDLRNATTEQVEKEFLSSNFQRRQLHMLDRARIAKRLYELERKRSGSTLSSWEMTEARDRVGKTFGMSPRNLSRYWLVLETPLAIQQAVRAERLNLVAAARIAGLPQEKQNTIAAHIAGLEDGTEIASYVAQHLHSHAKATDLSKILNTALKHFLRNVDIALKALDGQVDHLSAIKVAEHTAKLEAGSALILELLRRAGQADEERQLQQRALEERLTQRSRPDDGHSDRLTD